MKDSLELYCSNTEAAPIIADAIPATCPIGSIAIAFKLPNKVPNNKIKYRHKA